MVAKTYSLQDVHLVSRKRCGVRGAHADTQYGCWASTSLVSYHPRGAT